MKEVGLLNLPAVLIQMWLALPGRRMGDRYAAVGSGHVGSFRAVTERVGTVRPIASRGVQRFGTG